jgi:DNA-binding transcriptional ArsR family regulator
LQYLFRHKKELEYQMIGSDSKVVERKVISILRILKESSQPLGARLIANKLKDYGVELGERAVRYHLKLMDERGLTYPLTRRDGRVITTRGIEELKNALVSDKVGFVLEKIETLAFRTTFDAEKSAGKVPVNISLFPKEKFGAALNKMKKVFNEGFCISRRVAIAGEGERLGDIQGRTGDRVQPDNQRLPAEGRHTDKLQFRRGPPDAGKTGDEIRRPYLLLRYYRRPFRSVYPRPDDRCPQRGRERRR